MVEVVVRSEVVAVVDDKDE